MLSTFLGTATLFARFDASGPAVRLTRHVRSGARRVPALAAHQQTAPV